MEEEATGQVVVEVLPAVASAVSITILEVLVINITAVNVDTTAAAVEAGGGVVEAPDTTTAAVEAGRALQPT
jgi:hypothetical protein